MRTAAIFILILVVICAIAGTMVMFNFTKIPLWVLLAVGAGAVLVFWPVLRRLWLRLGSRIGPAAHTLVLGSLAMCAFLGINMAFSQSAAHQETGVIVEKYTKEHERRGGYKNRQVLGHYNTYHVIVALPDSSRVEYQVGADRFGRIHCGRRVDVEVTRGFFGFDVVNPRRL